MLQIVITGPILRRLVRGDFVIVDATDVTTGDEAEARPVSLHLSDIGYNVMLEAIKDAINAKDEAEENTDPDTTVS